MFGIFRKKAQKYPYTAYFGPGAKVTMSEDGSVEYDVAKLESSCADAAKSSEVKTRLLANLLLGLIRERKSA